MYYLLNIIDNIHIHSSKFKAKMYKPYGDLEISVYHCSAGDWEMSPFKNTLKELFFKENWQYLQQWPFQSRAC